MMARYKGARAGDAAFVGILKALFTLFRYVLNGLLAIVSSSRKAYKERQAEVIELSGNGKFNFEIVGESNYQGALEMICGGRDEESAKQRAEASLVLENDNPYDDKAVRIDISGKTVGYLSKVNARKYREFLVIRNYGNIVGVCQAIVVGGWSRSKEETGSFGVKLDLSLD